MQSGSAIDEPASSSRDQQYEPQNDTHYTGVARPLPYDHRRLESVMNHPALNTGRDSLDGTPHASPHGRDAMRHSSGRRLRAPQASQEQPGQASRAELAGNPQPTGRHAPRYDRSGPFDAVGYVRRDGQAHDHDELYEEYRQNGHVDGLGEDRSDSWSYL